MCGSSSFWSRFCLNHTHKSSVVNNIVENEIEWMTTTLNGITIFILHSMRNVNDRNKQEKKTDTQKQIESKQTNNSTEIELNINKHKAKIMDIETTHTHTSIE